MRPRLQVESTVQRFARMLEGLLVKAQAIWNTKQRTTNKKKITSFFCMLVRVMRTRATSPRMAERHPSAKPPQRLQAPSNGRIGLYCVLFFPLLKAHSATNAKPMGTKKGIPLNPNLLLTLNLIPWKTHCKVRHLFYNLQVFGRLFLKNVSFLA